MPVQRVKGDSFLDYAPYQILIGLCTGFAVTPINTIVDKSVIENANGKRPLWEGVARGFKKMFLQPKVFLSAYEFRWILFVYSATYATSNMADHLKVGQVDPALSKLGLTFLVNTTLSLIKDKALAQKLGTGQVRSFPLPALSLFFTRDIIAMASAFTIPPILGKLIAQKFDLKEQTALRLGQLLSPVLVQLVATPIHLLGLDLYNRQGLSMAERLGYLKSIYWNSVFLRMLRFLPAYGIGGIVNIELRKFVNRTRH